MTRSVAPRTWPWLTPALLLVALTAAVPVAGLLAQSFDANSFRDIWTRPGVADAIGFSLRESVLSTIVTLVIGSGLAWILARYEFLGRRFVSIVVTVPFVLPTVVVGASFLALLPHSFERSLGAVVAAHTFFNVSLVVRLVGPTWSMIDPDLLAAARSLGASRSGVIRRIVVPLAAAPLRSATALVFVMSFTSYGIVRILAEPSTSTIEVEIYRRAVLYGDTSGAATLALVQTMLILIVTIAGASRSMPRLITTRSQRTRAPLFCIAMAFATSAVFLAPIAAMVMRSVSSAGQWTMAGWRALFERDSSINTDVAAVVLRSLAFGGMAAAIATTVGMCAAVGLARRSTQSGAALLGLPMATSAVVLGFGIIVTYDTEPFDLRSAWWLIPVIHAVIALPFVVRAAVPIVQSIPQGLRDAAATLGASPWRRFLRIDTPLLAPAVSTALGLSMALSLGEFGATSILTRRGTETFPILTERLLSRAGGLPYTSAMATATLLFILTAAVILAFDTSLRS